MAISAYFHNKLNLWKKHPSILLQKLAIIAAILGVAGLAAFAGLAAWVSKDLPNPNSLTTRHVPQSTKIYDRTGQVLLYEIHGDEQRTLIPIEQIPDVMQKATVSIEDKGFYEHHGIYWRGLVRAVIVNTLKGESIKGTSTLTQQFVKNALLTNERSLTRKFKEFILSIQIERTFSKNQILQMYLNEIPYGSTLYGVESAAQTYFGKPARDLSLDEAALLAAIPQAPDLYSPYGTGLRGDNRPRLVGRQHYILDQMADQGYITKEQAEEAKTIETLKKIKPRQINDIKAAHFVMYIRSQLAESYGTKQVEQGGLRVITTLDWEKQKIAEEEVARGVEAQGKRYGFTNSALVSLDPKTGDILAMVGSKDFFDTENDGQVNVTLRPRQPGSSFKPIAYATAFSMGYLPQTQVYDVSTIFKTDSGDYTPSNYDGSERGAISLRSALQGSLNIPAVKIMYLVGVGRVIDFAERLGYTTFGQRARFGLALVLGGGEVKPIEHAGAYAAFANDGIQQKTHGILRVENPDGSILEEWKHEEGTRLIDEQVARLTNDVLSDNQARAYVFRAQNSLTLPDRPVAAKTGTTNNFHDAWTIGYTPNLATVVWVGNNNNTAMKRGADGSVIAAPIWQAYMRRATKNLPIEPFKKPADPTTERPILLGGELVKKITVDKTTGWRATEFTPAELREDRLYYEPHDILYYVDKDNPLGDPPTNPANDPQFANWESAVKSWLQRTNALTTDQLPPEGSYQTDPSIVVLSSKPIDQDVLRTRFLHTQGTVQSTVPIDRIVLTLEQTVIGESALNPDGRSWDFGVFLPPEIGNGVYTLRITALSHAGVRGETSMTIRVLVDETTQDPSRTDTTSTSATTNNEANILQRTVNSLLP